MVYSPCHFGKTFLCATASARADRPALAAGATFRRSATSSGGRMRAVKVTGPGVVEVVEATEPVGDGITVRIAAAGICGTDVGLARRGASPITLGHELAGVLADGTPVAIEPLMSCGTCDQCVAGYLQRCRLGPVVNLGIGTDGGMADTVVVPEWAALPLPAGLGVADAFLAEPAAVAMRGIRRARLEPGERVLVVGAGSIGLLAAAAASAAGAEVAIAARHPVQLAAAERLGLTTAIGADYDVVIDAAGSTSGLATAAEKARIEGRLVLLGVYFDGIELPGVTMLMKELTVTASMAYGHEHGRSDFADALALLGSRPEIAAALVTHRFPLDDAAEAFRVAADRQSGAIKVALET
jgi:2-desacetyl-2-hydroxyethyl bacteriochlorophyllide A dehydrogenase